MGKISSALNSIRKTKKITPLSILKKAPAIAKKAKYAGQVGITAARLASRVANPKNIAKMAAQKATGKGLVLPGSKYIGPGNKMNKGKPTSKADADAYQHDIDYDNYLKQGKVKSSTVYTGYSDADERLLKSSKKRMHKDPNALAATLGMGGKKLLNKIGLTKRIRDKDVYKKSGGKVPTPHSLQSTSNQYQKEIK
jgi:hypothetical protein